MALSGSRVTEQIDCFLPAQKPYGRTSFSLIPIEKDESKEDVSKAGQKRMVIARGS